MLPTPRSVAIYLICFASVALADDFKTIYGKEYKNATVSRVEPDGIVLTTKTGISKVYFAELPQEVQQRFRHDGISHSQSLSDQVFLTERVPVRTDSGSIAFRPGTALHIISKNSDTSHVTDGAITFDVPNNKLTRDANLAVRLAQNDHAAAEAIAQESERQMEAYRQSEAAKRAQQEQRAAEGLLLLQQQDAAEARQIQAVAQQREREWQAELKRRRAREEYIFQQQHKTPDVIVIRQYLPPICQDPGPNQSRAYP